MSAIPSDNTFDGQASNDYSYDDLWGCIDFSQPLTSDPQEETTHPTLTLPTGTQNTTVNSGEYLVSQSQKTVLPDQLTMPSPGSQAPNLVPVAPMAASGQLVQGTGLGITADATNYVAGAVSGQLVVPQQFGHGLPADFAGGLRAPAAKPPKKGLEPKVGKFDEKLSNRRTRGHQNPQDFYHPRPRPQAWGPPNVELRYLPPNHARNKHMFRYTTNGELEGDIKFTKDTLLMYTHGCKERNIPLRLWIQHPPSQSNWRYPRSAESSKCRYIDCPVNNHTILKGMIRVAFDECPEETGRLYDPFHCAGYMHLFCLEKAMNVYQQIILGAIDIVPDQRILHCEDVNPMALNRDDDGLVYEFRKWQEDQSRIRSPDGELLVPINKHRDILSVRLTTEHIRLQTFARESARTDRKRAREDDGGINTDIGVWAGDLDEYAKLKRREITRKKHERESKKPGKRKAESLESSDNGDEEEPQAPVAEKRRCVDGRFSRVDYNPPTQAPAVPLSMQFNLKALVSPKTVHASDMQGQVPATPSTPVFEGALTRRRSRIIAESEVAGLSSVACQTSPRVPVALNKMPSINENAVYPPKRETSSATFDVIQMGSPDLRGPAMDQRVLRPRRKREWADFEKGGENHILAKWEAEKYDYKRTARKRGRLNSVPF